MAEFNSRKTCPIPVFYDDLKKERHKRAADAIRKALSPVSKYKGYFERWKKYIPEPDIFELQLRLPLIEVMMRLLKYSVYNDTFNILNIRLSFYKWKFEFDLGETRAHRGERMARAKMYGQEYNDFTEATVGQIDKGIKKTAVYWLLGAAFAIASIMTSIAWYFLA